MQKTVFKKVIWHLLNFERISNENEDVFHKQESDSMLNKIMIQKIQKQPSAKECKRPYNEKI